MENTIHWLAFRQTQEKNKIEVSLREAYNITLEMGEKKSKNEII